MSAYISYRLDEVGLNMHYKWVIGSQYQIKGQYEVYSSIEHGNVIEYQMPIIQVRNQIG